MRKTLEYSHHRSQAEGQLRMLRDMVVVKLDRALAERQWEAAQAARYLGVPTATIHALRRGQSEKFTLDTLVELLFALDKPVVLGVGEQAGWSRGTRPGTPQDHEEAVAFYTQVLVRDPSDTRAYSRRASSYTQLGQFDAAAADYGACIELQPTGGWHSNRANVLAYAGRYQEALQCCDDVAEYAMDSTRGMVYHCMGQHEQAVTEFTRAIALDPERPGNYWNRALCYRALGQKQAATADFDRVLELDPTCADAVRKLHGE